MDKFQPVQVGIKSTPLYTRIKDDLLNEARRIWKPFKGQNNSEMIEGVAQVFTEDILEGLSHETISSIQNELDKYSFRMFVHLCTFKLGERERRRYKMER